MQRIGEVDALRIAHVDEENRGLAARIKALEKDLLAASSREIHYNKESECSYFIFFF